MRNYGFSVDIDAQGLEIDVELVRGAVLETLRHQGLGFDGEVSVLVVRDEEMAGLNQQYRGKEGTTDVLSFPLHDGDFGDEYICLGDIIINIDASKRQAEEYGHSISRELAFLTVHSVLHLLGYTHDDEVQESQMFAVQEEILVEMGLGR